VIADRYVFTAALSGALAIVVAVIAWETDFGQRLWGEPAAATSNPAPTDPPKLLPAFKLSGLETGFKETLERPLFVPTRRPAPAGAGTQTAMKKGQFRLAGTTVSEQVSVAYLYEIATNKTHRINKGAEIGGMTVESVASNRVTLKQGEEMEELVLRTSNSPRPPPPPAQVAGAPQPGAAPNPAAGQPGQPGQPAVAVAPQPVAPPGMPGSNFGPAGQPPVPPSMTAAGAGAGAPGAPSAYPPNQNPNNPAAAQPTADPNQPQLRRRRFQNLPQ
jgi:general secretion pathway protein N